MFADLCLVWCGPCLDQWTQTGSRWGWACDAESHLPGSQCLLPDPELLPKADGSWFWSLPTSIACPVDTNEAMSLFALCCRHTVLEKQGMSCMHGHTAYIADNIVLSCQICCLHAQQCMLHCSSILQCVISNNAASKRVGSTACSHAHKDNAHCAV